MPARRRWRARALGIIGDAGVFATRRATRIAGARETVWQSAGSANVRTNTSGSQFAGDAPLNSRLRLG